MRNARFILFLGILSMVLLCGCDREAAVDQDIAAEEQSISAEGRDPSVEEQIASAEEVFSSEILSEEESGDNTLDEYTAAMHASLVPERPEGELGGGQRYALGSSCGAVFKKHLFNPVENCWDELKIVSDQGEENSIRLAFREDSHNQAWGMGSIVGSEHFMMLDMDSSGDEGEGWKYSLLEIDATGQKVRTINMDFLSADGQEAPNKIMVDRLGNIHFITTYLGYNLENEAAEQKNYYFIANNEGTLLAKYDYSGIDTRLVALYDGRVAIYSQLTDDEGITGGSRLEYADTETGKTVLLTEFGQDAPKPFSRDAYYTLWDEKTLLYADNQGLHFADLSGNMTGDVYLWSRHGIHFTRMEEIQIQENGRINLIYTDSKGEGNLLCLEPTQEQREIKEIVFAVPSNMKEIYSPSVVEFNKQYPAYHIELKTDYEETALLTQLMSGTGPVLVDTRLTGFDEHRELWMPLEGLFTGEEWEDVLIPKAMELGEIDGTLYGVVSSFRLQTVVTTEKATADWDYEAFLDGIENNASIQAIFNGQNDIWSFMASFLIHGLEDNYLLNIQDGTTRFDSDEFRRVLRLAAAYCNGKDNIEPGESLLAGEVFCNTIDITRPEQIDLYRIIYGEDINYIGYPTSNGSAHYIDSDSPLAIRDTATDEEKRVAGAFLQMLLSEEGQQESMKDPNFSLSVRRDMLEEQINQINETTSAMAYGFPQITLGDNYDRESDTEMLYDLLEKAEPRKTFPRELNSILIEELGEYFAGTITEDILIERLTKRVELYLAEQY